VACTVTCNVTLVDFFLLFIRPPSTSTLFPYTTLFRSNAGASVLVPRSTSIARLRAYAVLAHDPCNAMPARALAHVAQVMRDFTRSEEHTSELQSRFDLVCRLLLEKKKI